MNRPVVMHDTEVQRTTVSETKCEFEPESVKTGDIQIVMCPDAAFHFHMGRHRFILFGEMLIDRKVIVHPPDRPVLLHYLALTYRLFDQALHMRSGPTSRGAPTTQVHVMEGVDDLARRDVALRHTPDHDIHH